jgi:hypothetical protein
VNNSDATNARGRVFVRVRRSALLKVGTPREDQRRSPAWAQPCRGLAEAAGSPMTAYELRSRGTAGTRTRRSKGESVPRESFVGET